MIRLALGRWAVGQTTKLVGLWLPYRQARLRSIRFVGPFLADAYLITVAIGVRFGRLE